MKSQTLRAKLFTVLLLTLLGVFMYVSQVILSPLPNIEIVSLLIIVITCIFGVRSLISIYIFVFCEIFTYGIHIWVINYLYVWAILCVCILLTRKLGSKMLFTVISGIFGLLFGTLCSIPYFITGGTAAGIAYIIQGIGFDLTHCVANVSLTFLLYKPLRTALERATAKYT